ncbi:MAG TPA: glycosyltransferase family 61 protein [Rhodopila sp.]
MSAADTAHEPPALATASIATTYFEQARLFEQRSCVVLNAALTGHPNGASFNTDCVTTTVRSYTLEDVVLDADSLILFKHGHAIPETAYFEPANAIRQLPDNASLIELPANEDFVVGCNNAHWGYQHWLTQCVPAIDWALRQQRTRPVRLVLPRLEPWQEQFLAFLGHDRVPRLTLEPGTRYRLPHVEYSDFLNGTTSFGICLSLLDTIGRMTVVPWLRPAPRILYIHDARPYYGAIRNEGEVLDVLRRCGVTIIEHGRLGVVERINLFRNADAIIGPLGQGLTDVLFCRPGTLLWEWMPRHRQNASFNRLAQAAGVDYWGHLFESVADPAVAGLWEVDLDHLDQGLARLSVRLHEREPKGRGQADTNIVAPRKVEAGPPIDALMLRFESLGDNCEFGLVQRYGGAEPLGLLRFNGFFVPPEFRLQKLVDALNRRFEGLGAPDTVTVFPDGIPGQRELIVRESVYEFWYHTGIAEGTIDPAVQSGHETTRLGFLRRKLLEDLETGEKTWVWKSQATTTRDQLQPLLAALRALGPNTLLWVTEADATHAAGTIEPLERDFVKGYIERFAPYEAVTDIDFRSWIEVCRRADECRNPAIALPEQQSEAPPRKLSAMERLAANQPHISAAAASPKARLPPFWRWLSWR